MNIGFWILFSYKFLFCINYIIIFAEFIMNAFIKLYEYVNYKIFLFHVHLKYFLSKSCGITGNLVIHELNGQNI